MSIGGASVVLAQGPGGIGGLSNRVSRAADENGIVPVIMVIGAVILVAFAVILFKLKRD